MNVKKFFLTLMQAGKPEFPEVRTPGKLLVYSLRMIGFGKLYGCSLVYRSIVELRQKAYQWGIRKQATLPCPVISIGNITTGGTGKTPMVIHIAQIFRQQGRRVAILTRGYRPFRGRFFEGNSGSHPGSSEISVRNVGDEPLLMASKLEGICCADSQQDCQSPTRDTGNTGVSQVDSLDPAVTVIVGSDRYHSGRTALTRFRIDVILLDDGLQHLRLARNCDIVLIDATNPFGGDYLLPAGLLREPVEHLSRAHVFVITRSDEVRDIEPVKRQLHALNPQAPVFLGTHRFDGIRNVATREPLELEALQGRRFLAVSGLGNPISFHLLLDKLGLLAAKVLDFPDHHWYTVQDIELIKESLRRHQLEAIVTTEKDEVKLSEYIHLLNVPVYTLAIAMHVQPENEFESLLLSY